MNDDNEILSMEEGNLLPLEELTGTREVFLLPLNKRPFFPGMAAPIYIEPGPFYEMLQYSLTTLLVVTLKSSIQSGYWPAFFVYFPLIRGAASLSLTWKKG